MTHSKDDSSRRKVRCPYCKDTEVWRDKIEKHLLKVHGVEQLGGEISVSRSDQKGVLGAQLDYLEKMRKLLLPQAFAFAYRTMLFTGDTPHEAHWLAQLLPDGAQVCVDGEDPDTMSLDVVVVGRIGFNRGRMMSVLAFRREPTRFIPQEGFLDELLFGRNWWNEEVKLLNDTLKYHQGLQCSKELFDGFARRYANPEERFRWPSTEIKDTGIPALPDSVHRHGTSALWDLGYRITDMRRSERWEILCEAVPQLGLQKVAEIIAFLCRDRKRQGGGRERYAYAIREWEHDLALLKREYYYRFDDRFQWPDSEP